MSLFITLALQTYLLPQGKFTLRLQMFSLRCWLHMSFLLFFLQTKNFALCLCDSFYHPTFVRYSILFSQMQNNPFLVHIPPAHVSEMPTFSTKLPMALALPETAGRESKRQRKYNPSLVCGYFHKFKHSSSWGPGKSSVWCSPTYLSAHKRLKYSEITTQTRERPPGCPSLGLLVKRKAGSSWGLFLKPMKSLTYLNSYFLWLPFVFFLALSYLLSSCTHSSYALLLLAK